MSWFENLTGCVGESPESVREHLFIDGQRLCSRLNGKSWLCGELETQTLAQLRQRVHNTKHDLAPISVCNVVGNVQNLHLNRANENAVFQVASQFNRRS